MKNKLIKISQELGLSNVKVNFIREDFDIFGYEIYSENNFVTYDRYFTGKTIQGNIYPSDKHDFIKRIKFSINQYHVRTSAPF